MGRRDPCRRAHGRRARVLRRRRPALVGGELPRQADRVLEVVRRVQGRTRPLARDRQADDRPHQRHLRGRRQRAADGLRPRGHRRRRVHPPRRPGARVGAGRRRDPVATDPRRRPPRPRDRAPLRGDPCAPRRGVGARQPRRPGRGARRRGRPPGREPRAQAPADHALRQAAPELLARVRVVTRRSTTPATGSPSRWRPRSRRPRCGSSWRRSERRPARPRRARRADRRRAPQPSEAAERALGRGHGGARRRARRARRRPGDPLHRARRVRARVRRRRRRRASCRARRRSSCTTRGASSAGTRSAASGRRSSRRSPATASAAAASSRWRAT